MSSQRMDLDEGVNEFGHSQSLPSGSVQLPVA